MATVYLAHDVKHDRKVALKVLKPELAAVLGAERFVVEIKTTASLQHPHILPLFDSGTADGALYYVMPYLEGETVRDKLNRETQFGVDEAVRVAREVADALDYAHRRGVIHRDIKPENILLHDGRAMVMDFGIALALSAAAGGRMTETGLSLGTPHYMSPEQATAEKDLTPRSDIYSLSCVLYEMLAGNPPHLGGSAQQIIMRIITDTPRPVTELRRSVPPNVSAAITKGLEKVPADRFENAKAFSDALAAPGFSYATAPEHWQGAATVAPASSSRRTIMGLAGVAVAALIAAGWAWLRPAPRLPATTLDLTLSAPRASGLGDVKISPDGSMLAYTGELPSGRRAIFLRHLYGSADFKMLAGTEGGAYPGFSPDNAWIVFYRDEGSLAKISVAGGGTTTILVAPNAFHPQWSVDQQIFYTNPLGTFVVPAAGGAPKQLVNIGGRVLSTLPDGSGVLGDDPVGNGRGIVIYDLKTDSVAVVLPNGRLPSYTANGYLLYVDDQGGLSAVPFDLKRRQVTGVPVRVLDRVAASEGVRGYSVSNNGTLVWHEGAAFRASDLITTRLVLRTFDGRADTLRLPAGRNLNPRISPNGRFVVYSTASMSRTNQGDIFVYDLAAKRNTQITFGELNSSPIWSPDGTHILYAAGDSTNAGRRLRIKAADNSGAAELLAEVPPGAKPTAWPRDDLILYTASNAADAGNLMMISRKPGSKPHAYLPSPLHEDEATLSPDGAIASYIARESGRYAVWLRDFPAGVGQWKLGTTRIANARWAPDGKSVYYWQTESMASPVDTLFRVPVDRSPGVVPHAPVVVATVDMYPTIFGRNWDLHPDGKRFVVVVQDRPVGAAQPAASDSSRYVIILNWFTRLEAAMAGARK
jgi:Tol biopolymer transport system component